MNRRVMIAFFAALGVLALLLVVEWLPAAEPPPVIAPKVVSTPQAEPQTEETRATDEWMDTVLQRPLFNIGRRPAKTAGKSGTVAQSGLPRLSGIIVTASGRRAIFMPDGGKPQFLAEGATLDDNTIRAIAPDRVTLAGPKGETVLRPSYDPKRPSSGTTTPPMQPFGQPAFPNGLPMGIPTPGFNAGLFQQQQQQLQQQQQQNSGEDSGDASTPPPPPVAPPGVQVFHPVPPRGRE